MATTPATAPTLGAPMKTAVRAHCVLAVLKVGYLAIGADVAVLA